MIGFHFMNYVALTPLLLLVSNWDIVQKVRHIQSADNSRMDESACLTVKNIGKPCAGEPHARFDEGG